MLILAYFFNAGNLKNIHFFGHGKSIAKLLSPRGEGLAAAPTAADTLRLLSVGYAY